MAEGTLLPAAAVAAAYPKAPNRRQMSRTNRRVLHAAPSHPPPAGRQEQPCACHKTGGPKSRRCFSAARVVRCPRIQQHARRRREGMKSTRELHKTLWQQLRRGDSRFALSGAVTHGASRRQQMREVLVGGEGNVCVPQVLCVTGVRRRRGESTRRVGGATARSVCKRRPILPPIRGAWVERRRRQKERVEEGHASARVAKSRSFRAYLD